MNQVSQATTSPWRMVAAGLLLAFGAGIFVYAVSGDKAAQRDFISYWAAGQQLATHSNPYDETAILRLEHAAGLSGDRPLMMRNPPLALFLAWPLGLVSAKSGLILWSFLLLASLFFSIRLLWQMHGRQQGRLHLAGYCFAPVVACLVAGQVGIFLLLGISLFLSLIERWPAPACAALLLCSIKPHLFVPFGLVLLAWALSRQAYWTLATGLFPLLAAMALAFLGDPQAWTHYARMMAAARMDQEFIPTLGGLLRLLFDRQAVWLQFVPEAAGCAWAVWYFWTRRAIWNWRQHGLILLLVSVVCAPYAWFSDEAVLLPAVLAAVYRAQARERLLIPLVAAAGIALIEVFAGVQMTSGFYLWTASAWLGSYLYATRPLRDSRQSAIPAGQQLPEQNPG